MNDEGKLKSLLQDGMGENFFLNCNFEFDTSGVRFGPDERCVNESNLHQRSGNFFKADSCEISMSYQHTATTFDSLTKQLSRLRLNGDPGIGWRQKPFTPSTEVERSFFGDALGDIHSISQTTDTFHQLSLAIMPVTSRERLTESSAVGT